MLPPDEEVQEEADSKNHAGVQSRRLQKKMKKTWRPSVCEGCSSGVQESKLTQKAPFLHRWPFSVRYSRPAK